MHRNFDYESEFTVGLGLKVVSLFSGAGGLDLGFHRLGFSIVYANDLVPLFCKTLECNKPRYVDPELEVSNKDIRDIVVRELPSEIDVVIGGPPCQTFSASGRRAGGASGQLDKRGTLFETYCRLINELQPRAFLFENVRGILSTNQGKDWQDIVAAFSSIGYKLSHRILDACDYGLPQQRERMFLVGHKLSNNFLFPEPTHGPDSPSKRPYITPRQAFINLETKENLEELKLTSGKYAHLLPLVPPGSNYLHFTAKRGYPEPIFAYRSRFSDFLYKADPDHTIKTLIASPGKYTGPFHWENRYFSIAEYKRLQGFPDDYQFLGNRSDVIKQIGNSVSPIIAEKLAMAIAKQIFNRPVSINLMPSEKVLSFDKRKSAKAVKTRLFHEKVVLEGNRTDDEYEFKAYSTRIEPTTLFANSDNVKVELSTDGVAMKVYADNSDDLYATMRIKLHPSLQLSFFDQAVLQPKTVDVSLYGCSPHSIQTMWNAIDDLVIRSSNYHSLFELYGHFTEPHPIFSIVEFLPYTKHPIAKFAKHVSDFNNCSRYFPNSHLVEMFGESFGTGKFIELVRVLRTYRYDIRCNEINIAIKPGIYMVAYPFILPARKQMNFSIR